MCGCVARELAHRRSFRRQQLHDLGNEEYDGEMEFHFIYIIYSFFFFSFLIHSFRLSAWLGAVCVFFSFEKP